MGERPLEDAHLPRSAAGQADGLHGPQGPQLAHRLGVLGDRCRIAASTKAWAERGFISSSDIKVVIMQVLVGLVERIRLSDSINGHAPSIRDVGRAGAVAQ